MPRPGLPGDGGAGLLFQDPERQLVMERVEDDVAFGLESRAWPIEAMRQRVPEALAGVGLAGFERRRAIRLSGGERQRLALAGVLAPRPGLLVLDEPTANLDPAGARLLWDQVAAIRAARSATLVIIAHDATPAWTLADHVLALAADGSPIDAADPATVLARSRDAMRSAGIWLPDDRSPANGLESPIEEDPVVTAEGVRFGFDRRRSFLEFSLDVGRRERLALVGPNGSGKSTMAKLLVGLLRPAGGRIRLLGEAPSALRPADLARRAGYVFQEPERQFLAGTVGDEIRLGLTPAGLAGVDELMARLGLPLDRFAARSPYLLSGGEQRRLSVATQLTRSPALLILDEPTFGQDRHGHEALLGIVDERVEAGAAVIAATHDERFVASFADRVVRLRDGRVEASS